MYQTTNISLKKESKEVIAETIDEVYQHFKKVILNGSNMLEDSPDTTEWDLNLAYEVNHACMWNKPKAIGQKVIIEFKNEFIAAVIFIDKINFPNTIGNMAVRIYRLEDLSPTEYEYQNSTLN